jgi:16S rRNA (cytosine1402-N4)-methyltransferase
VFVHEPVLLEAVLELLAPPEGDALLVDATLGEGGHAEAFLTRFPRLRVVGVDKDERILEKAAARLAPFGARVRLAHSGFADFFERELSALGPGRILMDLGVSMFHISESGRGFSFRSDEPLDMRLDSGRGRTAAELLLAAEEGELAHILEAYGEEPRARRIAAAIVRHRSRQGPITRSGELARIVAGALPPEARRGRGASPRRQSGLAPWRRHPATRSFQALRIAVNGELDELERALPAALRGLASGGRMGVISFHSLEDRIVKRFFRERARACTCPPEWPICQCGGKSELDLVTRKPVSAGEPERRANPASRSARLRVVEKKQA